MPSIISTPSSIMDPPWSATKLTSRENFELFNFKGDSTEIVIAIEETASPALAQIVTPPKACIVGARGSPIPHARTTPALGNAASPSQLSSPPRSYTTSPTLVRPPSIASSGTHSPVMRSMFPRFDPNLPLSQQKYYPNMDSVPRNPAWTNESFTRPEYSPSLYSQSGSPSLMSAKEKAKRPGLGCTVGSSLSVSQIPPPQLSAPEELLDMWSIANGQGTEEAAAIYTLGLKCDDLTPSHELITLISSTSRPLYTLHASSSSLTIARTHPINHSLTIKTTTPTFVSPTATQPLVTSIFPLLAELMAVDQSSTIASAHKLPRTTSADLQTEAILRAQKTESAELLWDSDSDSYHLVHPTLSPDGSAVTFPIEISPSARTVRILSPNAPNSPNDTQALVTLSLPTKSLIIHTRPLTALPSLYTLDTLLSTLLALSLHLHRTSALLLPAASPPPAPPTPTFAPPPTLSSPPSSRRSMRKSMRKSVWRSRRDTTATTTASILPMPVASPALTATPIAIPTPTIPATSSPPTQVTPLQPFDLNDPTLPRATKAVLRVLYGIFNALVWALGLVVGLLAAGVVGLGRVFASGGVVANGSLGEEKGKGKRKRNGTGGEV